MESAMSSLLRSEPLLFLIFAAVLLAVGSNPAHVETNLENLSPIRFDYKYGYINRKGELVIPPRFSFAGGFSDNGLALAEEEHLLGFIDQRGKFVIPPRFHGGQGFAANGLACVSEDSKWEFINFILSFIDNDPVSDEESYKYKKGYIDRRGRFVIPPRFDEARFFASNGLAAVKKNVKWGFIDQWGGFVSPPRFGEVQGFSSNGLAAVEEDGRWGYIDQQGMFVIPPRFDEARYFASNGLAAIRKNDQWGYIDRQGKYVIPLRFDKVDDFDSNGLAEAEENGKWRVIDQNGRIVLFEDLLCGTKLMKNARDEIVWPGNPPRRFARNRMRGKKTNRNNVSRLRAKPMAFPCISFQP
jgi:hypothetical protein